MRRPVRRLAAAALALVVALLAPAAARAAPAAYADGRVLVRWKPGVAASARGALRASVVAVPRASYAFIDAELLEVPSGTVEGAVARLTGDPRVQWAEPDYVVHASTTPDDPLFPQQWSLHNTGQTGGTPGADIHAPAAWDVFTGDSTLLVGIIDTGADYTHPELASNIWTNPGEIPGNGIDDDGDGYVDDVHGYDFFNNDGDPYDDNGHGTHVAGTIAARADNGIGVAGVCWRARLVPIKFLGAGGSGNISGAVAALQYALRIGVRITNNSWGGGSYSQALQDAVDAVGAGGQLLVAAAGNASSDNDVLPTYPAGFDRPWVIAVAASDAQDHLATFSNYGQNSVDLAAPGTDILSLAPGGGTRTLSGTSMATPHVTGVAALLWGRFPALNALAVKERLLAAVDTLPALRGTSRTGGRLNAIAAIADPDSVPPGPIADVAVVDAGSDFLTLAWTATGDDSTSGHASSYDLRVSTTPLTAATFAAARSVPGPDPVAAGSPERFEVDSLAPRTTYWLALRARDKVGNLGPVSNVVSAATAGPPALTLTPDSLAATLDVGGALALPLSIANTAEGTLDWSVPLPEESFAAQSPAPEVKVAKGEDGPAGAPAISGRGGPDAFGYRWVDSDQSDGPAFAWVDALASGAVLPLTGDDVISPPVDLGFSFPFYGARFTSVRVCTNGFLSFNDVPALFSNQPLPGTAAPPDLVAPFWDDLDFGSEYRVWTRAEPGRFTVEWVGVPRYANGGPFTFEAVLMASGEIRYQYLAMGAPTTSATVGLQGADRTAGLQVAFNAPYVHDSLAVRMVPVRQWLTAAPVAGRVRAGSAATDSVRVDASGLLAGVYRGTVDVRSNDPARPAAGVPVRLTVVGAPDLVAAPRALAFGTVFAGGTATRTLTVTDAGTDSLHVRAVTADDPRVSAAATAFTLAPGTSLDLAVTFAPPAPGALAATLTLASDDPDTPAYPVTLGGLAVPAPAVRVAPDSLGAALTGSATRTLALHVSNQGAGPYTFTADAVLVEAGSAAGSAPSARARAVRPAAALGAGGPDAFGYTWRDSASPGGPAFAWEDVRATGARLALSGDDALSGAVAIGFDFPFYGVTHRTLRVCTNGWVSFSDTALVTPANTPLPSASAGAPGDLLAVFWDDLVFGSERRAWVDASPARCIIQYQDVPRFGSGEVTRPNTFEIALYPDGTIDYRYLAVRAVVLNSATVGLQDSARGDGLQVAFDTAYLHDSLAVRIRPPVRWLSATPAQGVIAPDSALDLAVRMDGRGLLGGTYHAALRLSGDDPLRPVVDVPCVLTVSGVPALRVARAGLDFGSVYAGWRATRTLTVGDSGTDTLHVLGLASGDARVLVDPPKFAVPPGASRDVSVTFAPTVPGTLSAALTLLCDDPDSARVTVPLAGLATEPPRLVAAATPLAALAARGTLPVAAARTRDVPLRNDGTGVLHWRATTRLGPSIEGAAPLDAEAAKGAPGPPGTLGDGGPDPFGYGWTDSDALGGPAFAWVGLSPAARPLLFGADDQTVSGIALPFAFPFYGRTFDHVNVCTNGWLSFTSTKTTYTNTGLPDAGAAVPENLIAAFWDDQTYERQAGAGQAWWDVVDGVFVVSFQDVPHAGGGGPYTYQVLLHPDGAIDLQYLRMGAPLTSATIGIQDSSRTVGLQVMWDVAYVHDGLRVRLARVEPWLAVERDSGTVAPGAADTLRVLMRAADRDSARYRGEVRIATDDPARPELVVPCALDVALAHAPLVLPPAPLSAALGGDTLRVEAPAGLLAHPVAAWLGALSAAPRARAAGGWTFGFDLYAARLAAAAAGGRVEVAVEDSARAWVVPMDSLRVASATLHEPAPVRPLGAGGDSARVRAGESVTLAWDDPPDAPAVAWDVWLSLDGGHVWGPWALGLAERRATLALPRAPAVARLEITGRSAAATVWSWLSDVFAIGPPGPRLPLAFGLRVAGANPANGAVALEVALPARAAVTLEVLDVRGARVRRDALGTLEAGFQAVRWDGRDGAGHAVAPGLYFLRAQAGSASAMRRVVLLR